MTATARVRDRVAASRAARRVAWAGGVILAAGVIQAAHHVMHLPGWPYPLMAASILAYHYARAGWELIEFRRSGGRAAKRRRRKYQGAATLRDIHRHLSPAAVTKRAAVTRPSLDGKAALADTGVFLGRTLRARRRLCGTHEDSYLIVGPPRTGKTGWMASVIQDAPGACVATSSRVDVLVHTAPVRAARGPAWVLNPGGDGSVPTTLAWSPLDGCYTGAGAVERAGYLMAAAPKDSSGKDAWWEGKGHELLRLALHAAAVDGGTIRDAAQWVRDPSDPAFAAALALPDAAPGWAAEHARLVDSAREMLSGIVASAAAALAWLADPAMARVADPDPGTEFSAEEFILSRGTLYMIGADKPHSSYAPYFAALTAEIFEAAKRVASNVPSGRLDPPLTLALDEAAIICPVPLDRWTSEAGGHGVTVLAGVQAMSQLRARWGDEGGRTIFSNSTVKMIFGGLTDHQDLEALSAVCGDRDTWHKVKGTGGKTRQPSSERLFPPERIRLLPAWHALVLHRSTRPVVARVTPVWERSDYQPLPEAQAPVPAGLPVITDGIQLALPPGTQPAA